MKYLIILFILLWSECCLAIDNTHSVYMYIDTQIDNGKLNPNNLNDVIEGANEITAKLLVFSPTSKYTSFENLSFKKETPTHCVYYAITYKKVFDYIITKGNLQATCIIKREPIPYLSFIPKFFKRIGNRRLYNFTKDHDYCLINNKIKVDPTFFDYFKA